MKKILLYISIFLFSLSFGSVVMSAQVSKKKIKKPVANIGANMSPPLSQNLQYIRTNVLPSDDNTWNVGSPSKEWAYVYAHNLIASSTALNSLTINNLFTGHTTGTYYYYVSTAGLDVINGVSNDCSNSALPCATFGHARLQLPLVSDANGFVIKYLTVGTYPYSALNGESNFSAILSASSTPSTISIQGATTDQNDTIMLNTSGNGQRCFEMDNPNLNLEIKNLTVSTCSTAFNVVNARLFLDNVKATAFSTTGINLSNDRASLGFVQLKNTNGSITLEPDANATPINIGMGGYIENYATSLNFVSSTLGNINISNGGMFNNFATTPTFNFQASTSTGSTGGITVLNDGRFNVSRGTYNFNHINSSANSAAFSVLSGGIISISSSTFTFASTSVGFNLANRGSISSALGSISWGDTTTKVRMQDGSDFTRTPSVFPLSDITFVDTTATTASTTFGFDRRYGQLTNPAVTNTWVGINDFQGGVWNNYRDINASTTLLKTDHFINVTSTAIAGIVITLPLSTSFINTTSTWNGTICDDGGNSTAVPFTVTSTLPELIDDAGTFLFNEDKRCINLKAKSSGGWKIY